MSNEQENRVKRTAITAPVGLWCGNVLVVLAIAVICFLFCSSLFCYVFLFCFFFRFFAFFVALFAFASWRMFVFNIISR